MGMNFAFQLADKFRPFALLTKRPRSCRCILLSQGLSRELYDFFLTSRQTDSLLVLCHKLTPLPPQTPTLTWASRGQNFGWGEQELCTQTLELREGWSPRPSHGHWWAATPRHRRAEHKDGTRLALNSQCFPAVLGTDTSIRSHTASRCIVRSVFVQ